MCVTELIKQVVHYLQTGFDSETWVCGSNSYWKNNNNQTYYSCPRDWCQGDPIQGPPETSQIITALLYWGGDLHCSLIMLRCQSIGQPMLFFFAVWHLISIGQIYLFHLLIDKLSIYLFYLLIDKLLICLFYSRVALAKILCNFY